MKYLYEQVRDPWAQHPTFEMMVEENRMLAMENERLRAVLDESPPEAIVLQFCKHGLSYLPLGDGDRPMLCDQCETRKTPVVYRRDRSQP